MRALIVRPSRTAKRGRIMSHHDGEEILFILTGRIELHIGKRKEVLNPGDCVQFESTIPQELTDNVRTGVGARRDRDQGRVGFHSEGRTSNGMRRLRQASGAVVAFPRYALRTAEPAWDHQLVRRAKSSAAPSPHMIAPDACRVLTMNDGRFANPSLAFAAQ